MASVVPKDSSTTSSRSLHDSGAEPLSVYIRQSAKSIHRTELTVGFLTWLVMGLGVMFVFVLIDHWVLPFNDALRYGSWLLLVGGSLIWLLLRIAPLIGRSINPEYAAKRIEETIPEMKDGLISWLQLSSNSSIPRGVVNAVGRYVAKHLKGQDVASVIDQFASMKLAAMLFGMILIGAIYLAVSPKSGITTISRLLMPWADIAPSTRVQIINLTPGDATVSEGASLPVSIQVRGWLRGDVAQIRYSTDDRQSIDQTVAMNAEIEGVSYAAEFGKSWGGLVQPLHYYVEAGDAQAGPFAVRIQAVPLVVLDRIEYVYPAYMRLATRNSEGDGRIEAPEGTRVTVFARANQAIKKARIEFDTKTERDASFQVTSADDVIIEDRLIHASVLLKLDDAKLNPTRLWYRLRSENERGEENVEPVVYPIKVIPDLAPEVQLASNIKDAIDLPVNQKLGLEVRAMDPDFGLMRLSLSGTVENQNVLSQELFRNEQGSLAPVNQTYSFDPSALRLRPGMQVDIAATAEDNRRANGSDRLEPNIRQSRIVRIRIAPPSDIQANAAEEKNRSADPNASNSSEPSKATKNKQATNAEQKSKPDALDKANDQNDRKSSSEKEKEEKTGNQDEPPPKSSEDTQAKSSPDTKQQSQQNQEGQEGQEGPQDQKDQKQGKQDGQQQGQAGQPSNPSNEEKSGAGQSGAGDSGAGQSRAGDSGAGQSGAGENRTGTGQNQSGSGPSEGPENGNLPSAEQAPESGPSSPRENPKPNPGPGERGEPMHDGEAFDELRDALGQKGESGDADGTGQPTDEESPDSHRQRSSESGDTSSGKGRSSSDKNRSNSESKASDKESGPLEKPSSGDSGADQKSASSTDRPSQDSPSNEGSESSSRDQGSEPNAKKNGADQGKLPQPPPQGSQQQDGQPSKNVTKGNGQESGKPEPGQGSQETGNSAPKESVTDETDDKQGEVNQSSPSKNGSKGKQDRKEGKQGEQGEQGTQSQPGKQGSDSGKQTGESGKGSKSANKVGKGIQDSNGNLSGKNPSGNDGSATEPDQVAPARKEQATAEVEYARQATDMVLKALERQRDQPDPELLKRMGWSKEQLQAFLDRWKNARDSAAENPQKKREYDESLRSLGLMPDSGKARNDQGRDDRLRGLNEEGSRLLPPESLRERFEAFRKSTLGER